MSLRTAIVKLQETLIVQDLPELKLGIAASILNEGYPNFFIDLSEVRQEHGALQAVYRTTVVASLILVFGLHQDQMPSGREWFLWPLEVAEAISAKIEADTAARVYENDGDQGFYAKIPSWQIGFDPEEPIARGRMVLEIGAYQ